MQGVRACVLRFWGRAEPNDTVYSIPFTTVDDTNPALPIIKECTITPRVQGHEGKAGFISSTVVILNFRVVPSSILSPEGPLTHDSTGVEPKKSLTINASYNSSDKVNIEVNHKGFRNQSYHRRECY